MGEEKLLCNSFHELHHRRRCPTQATRPPSETERNYLRSSTRDLEQLTRHCVCTHKSPGEHECDRRGSFKANMGGIRFKCCPSCSDGCYTCSTPFCAPKASVGSTAPHAAATAPFTNVYTSIGCVTSNASPTTTKLRLCEWLAILRRSCPPASLRISRLPVPSSTSGLSWLSFTVRGTSTPLRRHHKHQFCQKPLPLFRMTRRHLLCGSFR
ncbi:uncharacterized protein LACBIDRAFT_314335 [Laccaria bicolor S238N-H82]|uniref:Predicted protein n=1 Tax=Laccaria bicolor (strain S238N-H82 / ATCC MYA-4686) TaxID=486041 RepID=B0DYB7_LACBS|nr:uncharacterized protein LACBIDRAFT_314335 [Laccaria bicolor S238N-H82]EDR00409.1 predicted protein [Laccaria bicolor S238N-H82]|eukprot:XP_001888968.1 predicted protein [Laccaria bicolor S238N-H82]